MHHAKIGSTDERCQSFFQIPFIGSCDIAFNLLYIGLFLTPSEASSRPSFAGHSGKKQGRIRLPDAALSASAGWTGGHPAVFSYGIAK